MEEFIFSAPGVVTSALAAYYLYNTFREKIIDGEVRTRNAYYLPSYTRKQHQLTGRQWSIPYTIFAFHKDKKYELNRFQYAQSTVQKNKPRRWLKKIIEKHARGKIDPIDLTKQLIVFGSMGSGKTVFFWNLLMTKGLYKRALVFDTKGDYRQMVNNINIFTLNIMDKHAIIWDIFAEKNFLVLIPLFVQNLINQVTGDASGSKNGNFFSNSAGDRLEKIFEKTYLKAEDKHLKGPAVWRLFIDEIEEYEQQVLSQDSKAAGAENKDVYNNLILALKAVRFWAWRASNISSYKLYTIDKFLNSKHTYIMHQNNSGVMAFYSGFLAAVVDELKRKEDTNTDFTMLLLDEYFQLQLDQSTRNTLHTLLRSKAVQPVIGVQTMPEKEIADKAFSSKLAFLVFRCDGQVIKYLQGELGKIEFKIHNRKPGATKDYAEKSDETRERFFVDHDEIENLPKYSHLYLNTLDKIYFLAKVDPITTNFANKFKYEEIDLSAYKREQHKRDLEDRVVNANPKQDEIENAKEGLF